MSVLTSMSFTLTNMEVLISVSHLILNLYFLTWKHNSLFKRVEVLQAILITDDSLCQSGFAGYSRGPEDIVYWCRRQHVLKTPLKTW